MTSETSNISPNQALEERLSNMHDQMAGVTSRLDQTERALDLERATREFKLLPEFWEDIN